MILCGPLHNVVVLYVHAGMDDSGRDQSTTHPSVEAPATEDDMEIMDLFNDDTKKSLNDGFLSYFLPEVTRLQESFRELV